MSPRCEMDVSGLNDKNAAGSLDAPRHEDSHGTISSAGATAWTSHAVAKSGACERFEVMVEEEDKRQRLAG